MKTIGLTGLIGSGKSTVAQVIQSKGYAHLAFGDKLKEFVALVYNLPLDMLQGDSNESRAWRNIQVEGIGKTPRQLLQDTGNAMRAIYPEVWVQALHRDMNLITTNKRLYAGVVVSDVRFANEYEYVLRQGGIVGEVVGGPKPGWVNQLRAAGIKSIDPLATPVCDEEGITVNESEWRMQCPDILDRLDFVIDNEDRSGTEAIELALQLLV